MRTAVMEGTLAEFDLSSVMQVVSLARQYTGIELFDEAGRVVGTLYLKSGKILEAKSGSLSGIDAVQRLLRGSRQRRFTVYRTEAVPDTAKPLGSVGEVLFKLMQAEATAPDRTKVMEGSLTEFDLMTVLQVISIGRQFTGVEVLDPAARILGKIELKAGQVVSAKSDHLEGVEAIRRLLRSPRTSRFVVYRSSSEVGEQHLGSLAQILMKISDVDGEWDAAESNTQARRTVADASHTMPSRPAPAVVAPVVQVAAPPPPPPAIEARHAPAEAATPFVDTYTSPFGLTTLPLPAGQVPVVCVTSPKGGAGKTTVTINLAVALARRGRRVVVVDSDHDGLVLMLDAKIASRSGAYDVVSGVARFADVMVATRIPNLKVVRSGDAADANAVAPAGWARLFEDAKNAADIVLVDTSAGPHGPSAGACAAGTHALVVVPAEPAGIRALPSHLTRLEALRQGKPQILGVVLNLLDYRARVSLDALRDLCSGASAPWVFDIPIARSPAFMEAVARGLPVCRGGPESPAIGWVFEMLASAILDRLGLSRRSADDAPLI